MCRLILNRLKITLTTFCNIIGRHKEWSEFLYETKTKNKANDTSLRRVKNPSAQLMFSPKLHRYFCFLSGFELETKAFYIHNKKTSLDLKITPGLSRKTYHLQFVYIFLSSLESHVFIFRPPFFQMNQSQNTIGQRQLVESRPPRLQR